MAPGRSRFQSALPGVTGSHRERGGGPVGAIGDAPLVFLDGDVGITHVGAGVDEGDEFGRIALEGFAGEMVAVFRHKIYVLEHGHLGADLAELGRVRLAGFTDEVRGGFGLGGGAVLDGLGFEVICATKNGGTDGRRRSYSQRTR